MYKRFTVQSYRTYPNQVVLTMTDNEYDINFNKIINMDYLQDWVRLSIKDKQSIQSIIKEVEDLFVDDIIIELATSFESVEWNVDMNDIITYYALYIIQWYNSFFNAKKVG